MALCGCVTTTVVTVPAPEGAPQVDDYQVAVNGKPVALYTAMADDGKGDNYYFGSFDFDGSVEVRISSIVPLNRAQILPAAKFGIVPEFLSKNELRFTVDRPFRICLETDGRRKPLLLFGNEMETDTPSPDDPNVVYFGPGNHLAGKIELKANQTLYLAAGSIVNGAVFAEGDNITIRGRGILAGEAYARWKGPHGWMMTLNNGRNITVRDIIFRNPYTWQLVAHGCDGVVVDNVKICGARMINDDGIDICNTRNMTVRNCFIRTDDDCIAIKGIGPKKWNQGALPCEHIRVDDCELWTDMANIYRIGYECNAAQMADIVSRNCDVLHYSADYRTPDKYWANCVIFLQPGGGMPMHDIHFEDIRINANDISTVLLNARSMKTSAGEQYTTGGVLYNCSLRNVSIEGQRPQNYKAHMLFEGLGEGEMVRNILLKNVTLFGEKVTRNHPDVTINDFTKDIEFQ